MMRISIRELAGITLIVALCLGWYLDHRRIKQVASKNKELRETLQTFLYRYEEETGNRKGIRLSDGECRRAGSRLRKETEDRSRL